MKWNWGATVILTKLESMFHKIRLVKKLHTSILILYYLYLIFMPIGFITINNYTNSSCPISNISWTIHVSWLFHKRRHRYCIYAGIVVIFNNSYVQVTFTLSISLFISRALKLAMVAIVTLVLGMLTFICTVL